MILESFPPRCNAMAGVVETGIHFPVLASSLPFPATFCFTAEGFSLAHEKSYKTTKYAARIRVFRQACLQSIHIGGRNVRFDHPKPYLSQGKTSRFRNPLPASHLCLKRKTDYKTIRTALSTKIARCGFILWQNE